jgi:hypothetical protein
MDKASTVGEIQAQVTWSGFLGTVSLFFTGILISQIHSFSDSIKVPVLYLIVATFSFIFSASIYANAAGELTRHSTRKVHQYIVIANNISEFLGLYLFVIATPLVINAITQDNFLRVTIPLVAIISLVLYSQSPFSILHREVFGAKKLLISLVFLLLAISVDVSQLNYMSNFNFYAFMLLAFSGFLAVFFCLRTNQLKDVDLEKIEQ